MKRFLPLLLAIVLFMSRYANADNLPDSSTFDYERFNVIPEYRGYIGQREAANNPSTPRPTSSYNPYYPDYPIFDYEQFKDTPAHKEYEEYIKQREAANNPSTPRPTSSHDPYIARQGEDFYYLDLTNSLSRTAEAEIYFNNVALQKKCGAQIVVVCVKTLNNLPISEYAHRLFNEWKVGAKGKNNGIVLVLAPTKNAYWLCQGLGTKKYLSISDIDKLLDENLAPDFFAGNYEAGVLKTFRQLFELFKKEYKLNVEYITGENFIDTASEATDESFSSKYVSDENELYMKLGSLSIPLLGIVFIVMFIKARRKYGNRYRYGDPSDADNFDFDYDMDFDSDGGSSDGSGSGFD